MHCSLHWTRSRSDDAIVPLLKGMQIRKATLEDCAELARLLRGTIRHINKNDYSAEQISIWSKRTSVKKFRELHHRLVRYVAVGGDRIVGFSDFDKEHPEIYGGLYVHKDHQRRGIGSRLMKKMAEVAKKMGAKKFRLEATKTAKGFYEKLGFRVIKRSKHSLGNTKLDVFVMEKKL